MIVYCKKKKKGKEILVNMYILNWEIMCTLLIS